jgi:hypothetical protein
LQIDARLRPRKCSDASDCVPHDQDNHRTDHCDQQAVEIETGHSHVPELIEQPAAYDCAYDSENDIQQHPFAALVHDFAADEPCQKTENKPS